LPAFFVVVVRFGVLTSITVWSTMFCDVTLHCLAEVY
jgi:hypothetical protein